MGTTRSIGLFGIVEVVRNRETLEPMAPFNGSSPEMQALGKFFRQEGLYTALHKKACRVHAASPEGA